MIWLSGVVHPGCMAREGVGLMLTPNMGNRPDLSATPWAADTGCYTAPERFSVARYLTWLDSLGGNATCLFATAPDRVGSAAQTLEVALPVLPLIRERVPAALVAQDGLEHMAIPWDKFDCLFIGGWDHWQDREAPFALMAEARRREKWVHWGRVNSGKRIALAAMSGCDSADGTFLAWSPDHNLTRLESWLAALRRQPSLLGS